MSYCRGDKGLRGPGAGTTAAAAQGERERESGAASSSTWRSHLILRVSVARGGFFWPRLLLFELMSITALMDVRLGRTLD